MRAVNVGIGHYDDFFIAQVSIFIMGAAATSQRQHKVADLLVGRDLVARGTGDVRVATARQFNVWEGGGEYNVARGLRRC